MGFALVRTTVIFDFIIGYRLSSSQGGHFWFFGRCENKRFEFWLSFERGYSC